MDQASAGEGPTSSRKSTAVPCRSAPPSPARCSMKIWCSSNSSLLSSPRTASRARSRRAYAAHQLSHSAQQLQTCAGHSTCSLPYMLKSAKFRLSKQYRISSKFAGPASKQQAGLASEESVQFICMVLPFGLQMCGPLCHCWRIEGQ